MSAGTHQYLSDKAVPSNDLFRGKPCLHAHPLMAAPLFGFSGHLMSFPARRYCLGLSWDLSAPALMAATARLWPKWMSATIAFRPRP